MKTEMKTLLLGILLGAALTLMIGAIGGASSSDFGFAIEPQGNALISTQDGGLYIVNPKTGMASRVVYAGLDAEPDDSRKSRAKPLFLTGTGEKEESESSDESPGGRRIRRY